MRKIQTALTETLGIDYPIIGAPMFLVSYEELAISVSEAGGLGCIPLPNYRSVNELEKALVSIRQATQKPIGVNIHLSGKFQWQRQLRVCLDAGVNFFITSLGDPSLITDDVHTNGGLVFADVISLKYGLKARDKGVDGLIAVAAGAGGHGGDIPTTILVPYLKKKTGLSVIAAGGISTGEQMAAAITLGADGVIVGTRLIASEEARVNPSYKQAVIDAGPEDIVFTDRITGNRANWIAHTIEGVASGPELGSRKWLDLWSAGQSVAQTEEIKPAGTIIREMVDAYIDACENLQKTFDQGE